MFSKKTFNIFEETLIPLSTKSAKYDSKNFSLLLFAVLISDILKKFCKSKNQPDDEIECLILGDVTYGACCVDDLASKALECDFIVHYGHSCLVPIQDLTIKNALYVFVEIQIDIEHFIQTIAFNFPSSDLVHLVMQINFLCHFSNNKKCTLCIR